ncbi:hypothetical protein Taro_033163 [Colocasia esculenta]|uniref:Bulb-type lectin domain-containing protein n=1 Tax=Colocasia esculenta TaxID=4460 RepID=A0A843VT65_COLES|nr:hypothetical protein [Colocasia esculenta]
MRTLPADVLCVTVFLSAIALVSAAEGDSLSVGQSIKHNESLVSGQGSFRLGFFTGRPNHTYLGIWYNRIPGCKVVWVANWLRPLPESTGSLLLRQNGSLVLTDGAGTVYWSTNPEANLSNPVARLLEDGNLVISSDDRGDYAWQSFTQPIDTLLPGMNIGLNRQTGVNYNLTSWKANDDPSPGDFSWVLVVRGVPQLFVVNGTEPLWRGGPCVEERFTGSEAGHSLSSAHLVEDEVLAEIAGKLGHPADGDLRGVLEVVDDDGPVAAEEELQQRLRRNLSGISAEEHGALAKISAEESQRMGEAEQGSPVSI